ncbi:hypothetical protein XENORESO_009818 [Xenotaenia resolanae]|uniref:Uncharacterized protein n=1 Tax=Xenotaenia resolanae TaxID=208358 RepID=A0ABV0W2M0_9TELE
MFFKDHFAQKSTVKVMKDGPIVSVCFYFNFGSRKWGMWAGPPKNHYSQMVYENGEPCWQGGSRTTTVSKDEHIALTSTHSPCCRSITLRLCPRKYGYFNKLYVLHL